MEWNGVPIDTNMLAKFASPIGPTSEDALIARIDADYRCI